MLTHDRDIDRRILQEARALAGAGHEVSVLARTEGTEDGRDMVDGVQVERVAVRGRHPRFGGVYRALGVAGGSNLAALWSILGGRHTFTLRGLPRAVAARADVYHAHDLNTLEFAHRAATAVGGKVVYDAHELFADIHNPWIRATRRRWLRVERLLVPRAAATITVNELIAEELAARTRVSAPLVLLNCPEVPTGFDPQAHRDTLRRRLGLADETRIVLFHGWLAPHRGLEHLVRSARLLRPGAVVVLLGSGKYRRKLERLAAREGGGRVRFLQPVSQGDLLAYCASADVGVIPYRPVDLNHVYTSPNKLFDLIAAQVPIVANDLPYLRRVVGDGGLGVVARLAEPADYARAIERALADGGDGFRPALREAAERYRWSAEAGKLVELYGKLAA